MTPVIFLFVSGVLEAVFAGPEALADCLDIASSYEVSSMCIPPTSDLEPYLGQKINADLRPKPNPFY